MFSERGVFMANPNLFIVRAVYDSVVEIHASGYTEYVAQFLHGLGVDGAQCTCSLAVVVCTEFGLYIPSLQDPTSRYGWWRSLS